MCGDGPGHLVYLQLRTGHNYGMYTGFGKQFDERKK